MALRKHILIVTFPLDDHFIPTLEFARRVSEFHDVTFAMSKAKLGPLLKQHSQFQTTYGDILFVSIDDGLTEKDVTGNSFINQRLDVSTEQFLKSAFHKNLQLDGTSSTPQNKTSLTNGTDKSSKPVNVLILDILLGGSAAFCHHYGVPYYLFNPFSSTLKLKLLLFDQKGLSPADFKSNSVIYLNNILEGDKEFISKMSFAEGIIINSMRELEMPSLYHIPLRAPRMAAMRMSCVGPLLPKDDLEQSSNPRLMDWLNVQFVNQVVFVSLGSATELKAEHVVEMGKALLQLGKPFIWSLALRHQQYLPDEMKKVMVEHKTDKGKEQNHKFMVVTSVPKKTVLEHPAVAVFVTNCDWNSVFQSLAAGKPLIAWPMSASQQENARFAERTGAGYVIGGPGSQITAGGIARAVQHVMVGMSDHISRMPLAVGAARTWREKIEQTLRPGGTSYRELTRLINRF